MFSRFLIHATGFAAGMASLILVQGCSFAPPSQVTPEQFAQLERRATTYDETHSYAWNISQYMGLFRFSGPEDTYIDDEVYEKANIPTKSAKKEKVNYLIRDIGLATDVFATGYELSAIAGMTSWNTGLTFGLLADIFSTPPKVDPRIYFVGSFPIDDAIDGLDAALKVQDQLHKAYRKAAEEEGFTKIEDKPSTKQYSEKLKREVTWNHGFTGVNEKDHLKMEFEVSGGTRTLDDYTGWYGWQSVLPNWIDDKAKPAWIIGSFATPFYTYKNNVEVDGVLTVIAVRKETADLKRINILERFAKYLPDGVFMYVPSLTIGDKYVTQPFVATNKRKYFFVMPKSALLQKPQKGSAK